MLSIFFAGVSFMIRTRERQSIVVYIESCPYNFYKHGPCNSDKLLTLINHILGNSVVLQAWRWFGGKLAERDPFTRTRTCACAWTHGRSSALFMSLTLSIPRNKHQRGSITRYFLGLES